MYRPSRNRRRFSLAVRAVRAFNSAAYRTSLVVVFLLAAEATCRISDYFSSHIAILASPSSNDLITDDSQGRRGTPHAQFKKWKLNAFGFRSPEITEAPSEFVCRVMVLGASEAFGLYESAGMEFPAQLQSLLEAQGNYEVVNAAVVGISVKSICGYWEHWASRFRPQVVVVYASPLAYLHDEPPGRQPSSRPRAAALPRVSTRVASRLVDRLRDVFDLPDFVQQWRTQCEIRRRTAGRPDSWYFHSVPQERLEMFTSDLRDLVHLIRQHGAIPVVLTHAIRADNPPRSEDAFDLTEMRVYTPRAMSAAICRMSAESRRAVLEVCRHEGVEVVDVAARISGRRDSFGDLVHFTDQGAGIVAAMLSDAIPRVVAPDRLPR